MVVIAASLFPQTGADGAAVCRLLDDGAGARLLAAATRLAAGAVGAPAGDFAISRAGPTVAVLRLSEDGTGDTAVGGTSADSASAGLAASLASNGAFRPGLPVGDDAVAGARREVANAGLSGDTARHATVGSSDGDGELPGLRALATRLGASGPGVPSRDAVDGAGVDVAFALLVLGSASDTAMSSSLGFGTGA